MSRSVGFVDPTITNTGGSFTASPSGLTIDSTSGRIIPDTSTPGNYIIEYSLVDCSATSSLSMEIDAQEAPQLHTQVQVVVRMLTHLFLSLPL